jgi:hypothetical protein
MKLKASSLAAAFLVGLIPVACYAQDFSADVEYFASSTPAAPSTASLPPSSKLYVSKDKIRLETRGLTGTVLLVNGGEYSAVALFPAKKAYQPLPAGPSEYFRVAITEDACPDWQKAADRKIACEKVGHEEVDGRQTVKYRNNGASDATTAAVWLDLALKFVVKWESADTGAKLRNIKEAPQTADLFIVPPDYKVLKPLKATHKGYSSR